MNNNNDSYTWGESILGLALLPIHAIWEGVVLKVTWGWFMVPTFGLPKLGVPQALGVALTLQYLVGSYGSAEDRGVWGEFFMNIGMGLVVLIMGYIYKSFM